MSGFTPGPWFVDEYIPKDRFNAVHQHVGVCDGSGLSVVALCGPAGDEQSQKDAFLISAAPDLLEACKGAENALWLMIATMPDCPVRNEASEIFGKIRSAIAKAEIGEGGD